MSARQKLNSAHFLGAAILAGTASALTGSWAVGVVLLAMLVAGAIHAGDIRPSNRRH